MEPGREWVPIQVPIRSQECGQVPIRSQECGQVPILSQECGQVPILSQECGQDCGQECGQDCGQECGQDCGQDCGQECGHLERCSTCQADHQAGARSRRIGVAPCCLKESLTFLRCGIAA